jgi:O-antigen/teichoic acid export membrane protein
VYGAAGLGFSGANLIMAQVLPTAEYGVFTLVIALSNLGSTLAPAGVDGIVQRRSLDAGPELLRRTMAASVAVGVVFTIVAGLAYSITLPMVAIVLTSTIAGGAMVVAGAQFQSERRFGLSLMLTQSPNLVLLIAGLVVLASRAQSAWVPLAISGLGFVVAGTWGWGLLFRERARKGFSETRFPWTEALAFGGLNAAGLVLTQLDRLVIPHVLPLGDLATYGVLAAIAGSFFRVLQMGVGYTLVARLRVSRDTPERRHLIVQEAKLVIVLVIACAGVIWLITPWVERWLLHDKYHLAGSLLVAAVVSGTSKILGSFTRATVTALATPAELSMVSWLGWVSVALAVPAAMYGARWGLAGVIYGVALGWLLRALAGAYVTLRHLKLPVSIPVTAP